MAPPNADDLQPTEDSPLLGRSPSGGNLPLTASYEDLRGSVEWKLLALQATSSSQKLPSLPKGKEVTTLNRRHAIFILLFGCGLSVTLVWILNPHVSNTTPAHHQRHHRPASNVSGVYQPFSRLDPVDDLGLLAFERPEASAPPKSLLTASTGGALPTNAWYQNMLLPKDEPTNLHRAYAVPYLLDAVGEIPGIRMHRNRILTSNDVMQLSFNENFGLTIGATHDLRNVEGPDSSLSHKYSVVETSNLGVTIEWDEFGMSSSIVRGMPYVTMEYTKRKASLDSKENDDLYPTIASSIAFGNNPIADNKTELVCSNDSTTPTLVKEEIEIYFDASDYSWLIFVSEPVWALCRTQDSGHSYLQIVDYSQSECDAPLIVRTALLDSCTTGSNPNSCREGLGDRLPEEESQKEQVASLLRHFKDYFPGRHTDVGYEFEEGSNEAILTFDWDVQRMPQTCRENAHVRRMTEIPDDHSRLLMYSLPHHLDVLDASYLPQNTRFCRSSISGPTCLVQGTKWQIKETLPRIGFQAARPPKPNLVPGLADALREDIDFSLPEFYQRGAGDTYFSGKMLAKLGRILLVMEELNDICDGSGKADHDFLPYCKNATLPSTKKFEDALGRLRASTEVWINGAAETPFVYDVAWGGVVSCGCHFNGNGCNNRAPDCPAFFDQGLNFGNGFYNDQHFHYGYMIFAAAVVAHFDPAWGMKYNENVLLLVRTIANPSKEDWAFPLYRHKDWYQGSSWASGVPLPPYLNGKNQESSSEAIAAYESVALYGQVMNKIWDQHGDIEKASLAMDVRNIGALMTATELRSARKYWHVMQKDKSKQLYPDGFGNNVVGILWSTMAQFGTWFGAAPYLPYGIQLLPLTPIAEERDDLEWVNEMYYPFTQACSDHFQCTESGWSILQLSTLATAGYVDEAAKRVDELPKEAFENAGGNGHSKSNTIWYIATRPHVEDPIPIDLSDIRGRNEQRPAPVYVLTDCHSPQTCTSDVLDRKPDQYSCREHMEWIMNSQRKSQWEACSQVAGIEYPAVCGLCDPANSLKQEEDSAEDEDDKNVDTDNVGESSDNDTSSASMTTTVCPPCTQEECDSDLNRCPLLKRTYLCKEGASAGGCSGEPWDLQGESDQCHSCCETTNCPKLRDAESEKITHDGNALHRNKCPPCPKSICYSELNQCPIHSAPYLCTNGDAIGGCASSPWITADTNPCQECCEVTITC